MNYNNKELSEILEEMYCIKTIPELDKCLRKICDYHMIEKIALTAISKTRIVAHNFGVFDSYPKEWVQRYINQKYALIDPVFHNSPQHNMFFSWHIEKFKDLTLPQKKMLLDAHDFGITFGTTLSLLPTQESNYYITLLGANINNANILYGISNAANYYLRELKKIEINNAINALTKKQQEILDLKKMGFPAKKIADILGKDISTIQLHIYKIKEKLEAASSDQIMYAYGFFEGSTAT